MCVTVCKGKKKEKERETEREIEREKSEDDDEGKSSLEIWERTQQHQEDALLLPERTGQRVEGLQ